MKINFYLFYAFLISSFCHSQEISNKFLQDLNINLELGKKYEMENIVTQFPYKNLRFGFERVLKLKKNNFFNEAELVFNHKNILTEIKLPFKSNNVAINELQNILSVFPDTLNKKSEDLYSLKGINESIMVSIERKYKHSRSYVNLELKYTDITESYNEFDKQTSYKTESDTSSERLLSFGKESSWVNFNYVAVVKKGLNVPLYYVIFQTENKSWKFFNEVQFLLDNEDLITLNLESKTDVTYDANASEIFIAQLDDITIKKLLQSKEISSRFKGKDIEKNTFQRNNLKPLEILINHFYEQ